MKIAIIGYSGAGKSTLAKKLGCHYQIPVLHLDRIAFAPNWQLRDKAEAIAMVSAFMDQESWIIEGNYSGFEFKRRIAEADLILFLNFPRWFCFFRAFKRYLKNYNKTRDDMAEGCIEKFDLEFMKWLLSGGRTEKRRQHYQYIKDSYMDKFVELNNDREVEAYLSPFGKRS